jgi:hypothetical protein
MDIIQNSTSGWSFLAQMATEDICEGKDNIHLAPQESGT